MMILLLIDMSELKGNRSKITCEGIQNVEADQRHIEFESNNTHDIYNCGSNLMSTVEITNGITNIQYVYSVEL
jgi:hypothetical protein